MPSKGGEGGAVTVHLASSEGTRVERREGVEAWRSVWGIPNTAGGMGETFFFLAGSEDLRV